MSFNQLLADQPGPQIAGSAVVMGDVHVGAGAILAQGLVVRAHGAAVSVGNYSAILENGVRRPALAPFRYKRLNARHVSRPASWFSPRN